ncbi:MAG: response regulator, partial [Deferrisomatales bacterium]
MTRPFDILVVDDEDSIRKRCVRVLGRQGYQVVGAGNSAAALAFFAKRPFDLVLADIRMPGVDGIDLLAELKR